MEIETIKLGHIQTNCYLISSEKGAIVIDPGFYSQDAEDFLKANADKERIIILTHCHFDHSGGALKLKENTDTAIAIGKAELDNLNDPKINLSFRFKKPQIAFIPDKLLKDNEIFTVGDMVLTVFYTPGHTTGGISLLCENCLFSGDTLFNQSIGRTDFPSGDFSALETSVKRLYTLPDTTVVYPGHGEITTIGNEKKFNPFVRV